MAVCVVALGAQERARGCAWQRATNLFVYGPDGEFIDGARILDQDGRPVKLTPDGSLWDPNQDVSMFWEPREDVSGGEVWNAYPLGFWTSRMANWDADQWVLPEGVNVRPQTPPVASLNAMAAPDAATSSDGAAAADAEPDSGVPEDDAPKAVTPSQDADDSKDANEKPDADEPAPGALTGRDAS